MVARFLAGVACFLATVAIATAWVAETRYGKVRSDLRDQRALFEEVSRAQSDLNNAQGHFNKVLYRSQMRLLRAPSRSLAFTR